jgi:hypothetical protein
MTVELIRIAARPFIHPTDRYVGRRNSSSRRVTHSFYLGRYRRGFGWELRLLLFSAYVLSSRPFLAIYAGVGLSAIAKSLIHVAGYKYRASRRLARSRVRAAATCAPGRDRITERHKPLRSPRSAAGY